MNAEQLKNSPEGLGSIARDGLELTDGESRLMLKVQRVMVYPNGTQPDFSTLDEAKKAFLPSLPLSSVGIHIMSPHLLLTHFRMLGNRSFHPVTLVAA